MKLFTAAKWDKFFKWRIFQMNLLVKQSVISKTAKIPAPKWLCLPCLFNANGIFVEQQDHFISKDGTTSSAIDTQYLLEIVIQESEGTSHLRFCNLETVDTKPKQSKTYRRDLES